MTTAPNRLTFLLHRLSGVAEPARVRAFGGTATSKISVLALPLTIAIAMTVGVSPALAGGNSIIPTGQFGAPGSGAGELSEPMSLAVNDTTKALYVADKGNNRIDEFESDGTFIRAWGWGVAEEHPVTKELQTCEALLGCFKGESGSGAGELSGPEYIAVNNSTTSVAKEDLYVADTSQNLVDQFTASGTYVSQLTGACETAGETPPGCAGAGAGFVPFEAVKGVAVDPEGNLWVYYGRNEINVSEFSDTGVFLKGFHSGRSDEPGFTVDSQGDVYTVTGSDSVSKWEPATGTEISAFGFEDTAIAVDPSTNNVFTDNTNGKTGVSLITEYGPFGEPYETTFATGPKEGLVDSHGIAVTASATPTVYATQSAADDVETFKIGILPTVVSSPASDIYPRVATLNGTVNPEGVALTECAFEYVEEAQYNASAANPYAAGHTAPCAEGLGDGSGEIGEGTEPVEVKAEAPGLTTGTTYHFRLVAKNANGTESGADATFQTTPPTTIEESVSEVADTSATLEATIDPSRAPTTYHFEYDTTEYHQGEQAHGTSVPIPDASIGSGETSVAVSQHVQTNLSPGTVYHYRLVAISHIEVAPHEFETREFDGPDHTFTTQQAGGSFSLPDGRQWEMVSPPSKHGAGFEYQACRRRRAGGRRRWRRRHVPVE